MKASNKIQYTLIKRINKIDVRAGNMTFFQRIELGKIMEQEGSELHKAISIIELLHGFRPNFITLMKFAEYIEDVIQGMIFWVQIESTMLKYEPTADEKKAGISDLSKKIGEMGTVISMAEKFSQDPDDILKWKYSKVFGLLYADLEKAKFNRKYQTIIEKKSKVKNHE